MPVTFGSPLYAICIEWGEEKFATIAYDLIGGIAPDLVFRCSIERVATTLFCTLWKTAYSHVHTGSTTVLVNRRQDTRSRFIKQVVVRCFIIALGENFSKGGDVSIVLTDSLWESWKGVCTNACSLEEKASRRF
jgi:hypothetical protein